MITKAEIAEIRGLESRKNREQVGLYLIEGHKMVEEAIITGVEIERIIASEQLPYWDQYTVVTQKQMRQISKMKTPQGVVALAKIPKWRELKNIGDKLTIALDGVQDPGNMGTIIRIADWFGIEQIICSESTADCFNPKVVQATMGAIFRVEVHYTDLSRVLRGVEPIYGAFLEGENIYQAELKEPSKGVIVMGSEGAGVSQKVERMVSKKLYIPTYPQQRESSSESLNVATATAIICSEFRRRATYK